jgi:uncharacterized protein YjiS (DUF1127 family)
MHTISEARRAEGLLTKAGLVALWVGELFAAFVWHTATAVVTWQARIRERQKLASLDDRMLRDIGLSRADVHAETRKPFWQP